LSISEFENNIICEFEDLTIKQCNNITIYQCNNLKIKQIANSNKLKCALKTKIKSYINFVIKLLFLKQINTETIMQKRRYPGVSPFTSEQKNIFYGRDNDIVKLHKLIQIRKQVLLYAKSGIGKTSLLNAGVLPLLENKFIPLKIRLTAFNEENFIPPVKKIIDTLQNYLAENDIKLPSTYLQKIYISDNIEKNIWYFFKNFQLSNISKKNFILVFDQFEELFSYPQEMIDEFKEEFHQLTNTDIPAEIKQKIAEIDDISDDTIDLLYEELNIKTVFAIRSDRLSLLNQLTDKIPDIQETFYELKPLDDAQTKAAIINPAISTELFDTKQFKFDANAVASIISALTENRKQNVESTQLQIVCQKIEDLAQQKYSQTLEKELPVITEKDLPEFKDIFLSFYDDTIFTISNDKNKQNEIRKFIEDQLIRNNQRISLDEIICTDYVSKETLQKLVNQHLLRAERNSTGGFSYELSHDTLIDPISSSRKLRIEKEQAEIAEKQRLEELRIAKEKAEQERKEREKERKRQRTIITIVSIAAAISLGFAVFGFWQMNKAQKALFVAEEQKQLAEQREQQIKKATTDYYLRDAEAYISQREFRTALEKFIYLRDSIMLGETTEEIEKRIIECNELIKTQFLYDSLMTQAKKSLEIQNYEQAINLYEQALKTGEPKDKIINILTELLIEIDEKIRGNLQQAEALKPFPKYKTKETEHRNQAAKLQQIKNKINILIK